MRDDREGRAARTGGALYDPSEWRERGIRARRFKPCPHCGAAVTARERVWTPWHGTTSMVFREARCVNSGCGWRYFKHNGSREEFVAEANQRSERE